MVYSLFDRVVARAPKFENTDCCGRILSFCSARDHMVFVCSSPRLYISFNDRRHVDFLNHDLVWERDIVRKFLLPFRSSMTSSFTVEDKVGRKKKRKKFDLTLDLACFFFLNWLGKRPSTSESEALKMLEWFLREKQMKAERDKQRLEPIPGISRMNEITAILRRMSRISKEDLNNGAGAAFSIILPYGLKAATSQLTVKEEVKLLLVLGWDPSLSTLTGASSSMVILVMMTPEQHRSAFVITGNCRVDELKQRGFFGT